MGPTRQNEVQNPNAENQRRNDGNADKEKYDQTRVMFRQVNKQLLPKLEKSAVGETMQPMDIKLMEDKLRHVLPIIENVREMGSYKTLITFLTTEDMLEILKEGGNMLGEYFAEIRAWTKEKVCQTQ